jgi:hypothetical protein
MFAAPSSHNSVVIRLCDTLRTFNWGDTADRQNTTLMAIHTRFADNMEVVVLPRTHPFPESKGRLDIEQIFQNFEDTAVQARERLSTVLG